MDWIFLGLSSCFLGLTIFISHEISRGHSASTMLKIGLVSFALEFFGLSAMYIWMIFFLSSEKWYRQYLLLSALGTTLSGFLSATAPFLVYLVHRGVDWELVLWVSHVNKSFGDTF
jgi:hypothetical protein